MRRLSLSFCLALALALVCTGCKPNNKTKVLRLNHVLDPGHPVHKAMVHMGERLRELSDGQLRLRIFPGGQLGNERESVELLQLGTLDMTKVSAAVAENFVPEMGVFSLPYLFRSRSHYWKVFRGEIGKDILLSGVEDARVRGLCFYDAGFRSFYTKGKAIHKPSDLQGMKIRVMRSNLSIRTINALGGNATPMAYGELYTALQQGIVDGAENNPPNYYQSKHYEQTQYYSLDGHSAPPDVLLISTYTWNKLSKQERSWVKQAAAESVSYQKKLWTKATQEALKEVKEAGVTVVRPEKEPFRQAVEPIYQDMKGTLLGRLADRIRSLVPSDTTKLAANSSERSPIR